MPPKNTIFLAVGAVVIFLVVIALSQATYVVDPGHRGVRVTLGRVSPVFEPEGFGLKPPFITSIEPVLVRQQTEQLSTLCYSSDLQQVRAQIRVLYRIPQESVVEIFRDYYGEPFQSLISPRVQEALKEITALSSAEHIVQKREEVKARTFALAQQKIGDILKLEDLVIEDIALSPQLEAAIELKMVQEQEANKARFIQQKAEIEAQTAVIEAEGVAEAIQIQGAALRRSPVLIQLEMVQKWDGRPPVVIGGETRGANMILPLRDTSDDAGNQGMKPSEPTTNR